MCVYPAEPKRPLDPRPLKLCLHKAVIEGNIVTGVSDVFHPAHPLHQLQTQLAGGEFHLLYILTGKPIDLKCLVCDLCSIPRSALLIEPVAGALIFDSSYTEYTMFLRVQPTSLYVNQQHLLPPLSLLILSPVPHPALPHAQGLLLPS